MQALKAKGIIFTLLFLLGLSTPVRAEDELRVAYVGFDNPYDARVFHDLYYRKVCHVHCRVQALNDLVSEKLKIKEIDITEHSDLIRVKDGVLYLTTAPFDKAEQETIELILVHQGGHLIWQNMDERDREKLRKLYEELSLDEARAFTEGRFVKEGEFCALGQPGHSPEELFASALALLVVKPHETYLIDARVSERIRPWAREVAHALMGLCQMWEGN